MNTREIISIDLSSAEKLEPTQSVLDQFLKSELSQPENQRRCVFTQVRYSFLPEDQIEKEVQLSHVLVQRYKSLENGNKLARYDILDIDKRIGRGAYAIIYKVIGTLAYNDQGVLYYKSNHQRVVKFQRHLSKLFPYQYAVNENEIVRKLPHLHAKEIVLHKKSKQNPDICSSFFTMKHLGEQSLLDLIEREFRNLLKLSVSQRLTLTIAMINAVINQVHQYQIIHADIKPNNFRISESMTEVYAIDFGNSNTVDNAANRKNNGMPGYSAPELFDKEEISKITFAIDTYSTAMTISMLWGDGDELLRGKLNRKIAIDVSQSTSRTFNQLFCAPYMEQDRESCPVVRQEIKGILRKMSMFASNERISLPESEKEFERLLSLDCIV